MTDYIRLLLEEQEDGESGQREEGSWRPKEEGLALPLSDVGEKDAPHPAWREECEPSENQKGPGEMAEDTRRLGETLFAAAGEAPSIGRGSFTEDGPFWQREAETRTEKQGDRGEAPDPLWQLWTARWLEAGSGEGDSRAEPDGLEETARSVSGGPEEYGTSLSELRRLAADRPGRRRRNGPTRPCGPAWPSCPLRPGRPGW